jgi:hypothetical protein
VRVARRLSIGGIGAAIVLAVAPAAALAWVRTAKAAGDPQTTWIVTQNSITIRSTDPVLLKFVRGTQILFGCDDTSPPVEPRHHAPNLVWGRTASSITAHVTGLNARDLTVCSADDVGGAPGFPYATGDFSRAPFNSAWRKRLAGTAPPGRLLAHDQLSDYWLALSFLVPPRYLDRFGIPTRLPPAPALVRYADRRLSRARDGMLYAPTRAGVTVPRVVYAIGQGWGAKRLEFAVIGFDGRRYVLRAKLGYHGPPKFGPG